MPIKGLYLRKLALRSTPQNGGTIDRARDKTTGVFGPANVHNVSDMTTKLARMTPLDSLLLLSELSREKLKGPYNDHLIVRPGSQKLPTWRESDHVYGGGVTTLQIIAVFRYPFYLPVLLLVLH